MTKLSDMTRCWI